MPLNQNQIIILTGKLYIVILRLEASFRTMEFHLSSMLMTIEATIIYSEEEMAYSQRATFEKYRFGLVILITRVLMTFYIMMKENAVISICAQAII